MLTGYFSLTLVRNAVMYRIVPSHTSLSFSYSGNTLTGSYRLSIKVYEQDGDKAIDHTIQPAPIYTYCGFDGDVAYNNSIYSGIDISASAASGHKNYTIEIWLGQKGSEGAVKVDRVTIPILKDGADGQQGNRGPGGAKPRTTEWNAGTRYLKGDEGEEYYDMVDYQGYMYLCVRTHTSSAGAPPPGNSNWQLQFRQPFITADTLRSYRIYADQIDADGLNANNVNISGHIVATSGSFTGEIIARSGRIGGFTIENGRLDWKQRDYFGSDSRSLKLGASTNNDEGIVDISFNAATQGRYGVRVLGSNLGGASILAANRVPTSSELPSFGMSYAGFFVGPVFCVDRGHGIAGNIVAATSFRCIKSINSDGSYEYNTGVDWDRGNSPDLDRIRLIVKGGLIVGYYKE